MTAQGRSTNIVLDNVLALCLYISRPARQRGTSGGVWSWGGIVRCEVRLKRPERARVVGRSEAPHGEALRSDAALSPGRHSPGALRVPPPPRIRHLPGGAPGLGGGLVRPILTGMGPRGDALKAPTRGPKREARDQGAVERGVFRVRVALGTWPWALALPSAASHTADGFLPPRGPQTRAADPAPRTRPGAPRARPSLLFEGRDRADPHASDPERVARRRSHARKHAHAPRRAQ